RPGRMDVRAMRHAGAVLLGEHDFASFCRRPHPPAGTVRRLTRLAVATAGEEVRVTAEANAFCHQMVRSLVGTLAWVGDGRIDPESMAVILGRRNRAAAGQIAPPNGLMLVHVGYGAATPRGV